MAKPTVGQLTEFFAQITSGRVTKDNIREFLKDPDAILFTGMRLMDFCIPLSDERAEDILRASRYVEYYVGAHPVVLQCRKFAKSVFGWKNPQPIFYRVKAGFNFRTHAPRLGHCNGNWKHLQDWTLYDEGSITGDSLVFCVPLIVPGSLDETREGQLDLLKSFRRKYNLLPDNFLTFGDASLFSLIILRHYELSNERVPLNRSYVCTDTLRVGGCRLLFSFGEHGLNCSDWSYDNDRRSDLGCFALGVIKLGGEDKK